MLRNLHQPVVHTSAALSALGADVASEPKARLVAALVQLNRQMAQRALHPFAAMRLFMEVEASASIKQLTHRYAEERCVLLQCLVTLVRKLDLNNRHGCLGDVGVGCYTVYILTVPHLSICLTMPHVHAGFG